MTILISVLAGFFAGVILILVLLHSAVGKWRELNHIREQNARHSAELDLQLGQYKKDRADFESKAVSYQELRDENLILKRDLRNIDVNLFKVQVDRDLQADAQASIDSRSQELARRYLSEVEKWVGASINANNYAACKQRLVKAMEWCREIGYTIPLEREEQLLADLKADYEKAVRAALEREEQVRIKAQIREEQQREKEIERELQALERERFAIKTALDKALADTRDAHSEEIQRLQARLSEAEQRVQRTVSQAQLTKAGHIYVISNLGSFGENVFKIGMTRRLAPEDRISELSDASVPFEFDVHMMISCKDAPTLENKLHKEFHKHRLNKVNLRKEFFRVELEAIRQFVEKSHGQVNYIADVEALEYRQSLTMSAEDQEYIETVFETAEKRIGMPDIEE